ncbi:MAG TPA: phosphonate ABC transporter substrate-binding protein [Burkholderiales bacterium]|jgi:phosphonate transport system substrate-binding protein|nr:phosphonate ABC transporter substrate-binding protein [Burkholderiales bacterium]
MLRKLIAALVLPFAVSSIAHAQVVKEINFGIISTETSGHLKDNWQPLLDDMAKRTGLKVNAYFASDYAGIIEAQRFNKIQVAWYGNKSAMEAVDRANGEVFAQMIAPDGAQGYYSLLVVHKDSSLKSVEDVLKNGKSLNFGIGDPNSTSGYLVPMYYVFALNKADPKSLFKTVRGANHEANLLAVVNKQLDVATNNTENLDRFTARFPEKAAEVRVIWKSPLIASDPLVWRKDLPADVKTKIRTFVTSYGTGAQAEREKENLKKITAAGFKPSDNRQLLPIRQLELYKDKVRIESDLSMDAAVRKERLDEIGRKLAELSTQMAAK